MTTDQTDALPELPEPVTEFYENPWPGMTKVTGFSADQMRAYARTAVAAARAPLLKQLAAAKAIIEGADRRAEQTGRAALSSVAAVRALKA